MAHIQETGIHVGETEARRAFLKLRKREGGGEAVNSLNVLCGEHEAASKRLDRIGDELRCDDDLSRKRRASDFTILISSHEGKRAKIFVEDDDDELQPDSEVSEVIKELTREASPAYYPASFLHQAGSPQFSPVSPQFSPISTHFSPASSGRALDLHSPGYSSNSSRDPPASPSYKPTSPVPPPDGFAPPPEAPAYIPSSPLYPPISPRYYATSPSYSQSSPPNSVASSGYSASPSICSGSTSLGFSELSASLNGEPYGCFSPPYMMGSPSRYNSGNDDAHATHQDLPSPTFSVPLRAKQQLPDTTVMSSPNLPQSLCDSAALADLESPMLSSRDCIETSGDEKYFLLGTGNFEFDAREDFDLLAADSESEVGINFSIGSAREDKSGSDNNANTSSDSDDSDQDFAMGINIVANAEEAKFESIPSTNPNANTLLTMNYDSLRCIFDQLDPGTAVIFGLTCKHLYTAHIEHNGYVPLQTMMGVPAPNSICSTWQGTGHVWLYEMLWPWMGTSKYAFNLYNWKFRAHVNGRGGNKMMIRACENRACKELGCDASSWMLDQMVEEEELHTIDGDNGVGKELEAIFEY